MTLHFYFPLLYSDTKSAVSIGPGTDVCVCVWGGGGSGSASPSNLWTGGAGTTLKMGGGGEGQTSPGVQGNPYPKLKTPRICPTVFCFFFFGET